MLLASGKAVPISSLKPGEKVVATNTKTGTTQAGTIAAVLVHHDTNRYDLTVRARGRTAVIHTTSNHPFWDATTHRWVKAGALRHGTHLRTPAGGTATVLGGSRPKTSAGWMWDLTIPGDQDFYIATTAADILVHNCSEDLPEIAQHVIPRHTPGGAEADATRSLFDPGTNLEQLAEGSAGRIGIRQAETGNIRYFIRARTIVGTDRFGNTTNVYDCP